MPDVFLSYSSKDRAAAQRVQEALAARGIDVFWDQATPPGQDWDTWIRGKLSACKVAIVLWSRTSVASDNVRHEALVARKAKKLLPALIDSIPAEDLPMGLYIVQATGLTDWRDPDSAGMARLIAEVETRVGKRAPGAPAASAMAAAPQRKINWVGVAIGLVLVIGGVGLTQWIYSPKDTPVSPGLLAQPCANNLPRLSDGSCPAFDPTRVLTPTAECLDGSTPVDGVCDNGNRPIPPAPVLGGGGGARADAAGGERMFSNKILGMWNWEGLACGSGPNITMENGQLVFTTPDSRFVYAIESDGPDQAVIRQVDTAKTPVRYTLSFQSADNPQGVELLLIDRDSGAFYEWTPCTP